MTEKVTKKALQILQSLIFDGSFNINKILIPFMLTKNEKPSVAKAMAGKAERVGFEPTVQCNPYDDLANRSFRPLRHLSKYNPFFEGCKNTIPNYNAQIIFGDLRKLKTGDLTPVDKIYIYEIYIAIVTPAPL